MNRRGQALTEFILILPVVIIILLAVFNISYIYIEKYNLESNMSTVSDLYKNGKMKELKAFVAKQELTFEEKKVDSLVTITLSKKINVSVPVLKEIFDGENLETEKTIYMGEDNE